MNTSHTFVDMYVRPEILAFTNVGCFSQLQRQLDPGRDLLGVSLLKTFLDEDIIDNAPNCGRKDDPCLHISYGEEQLALQKRLWFCLHLLAQRPR